MQTSEELRAHLQHGAHEIRQIRQLLGTALDRAQTISDEIRMCSDRVKIIDPTIDTLNREIHRLTTEMDRLYALRDDEGPDNGAESYLRRLNAQLRIDLAALQKALQREKEQHQADLSTAAECNNELKQRALGLERFNDLLKTKLNEMREKYESAIIDNVDLRDTNANQAATINTLQNTPAFHVIADNAASSYSNRGTSPGPTQFGKTVVETNRGLTVTIESSRDSSPEKASLHHGWIPELPNGASVPFPDILPQPISTSPVPANDESQQAATRTPGRPKARAIVKGTQEANESFERMKRSFLSSPLPNFTNIVNIRNDATATSSSSASVSGAAIPIIRPFAVHPVMPSKAKSKLNPAVEPFTPSNPSNSSDKDSMISGNMKAASPSKSESEPLATVSNAKDEGFIPPHLRRPSKISTNAEPVTTTGEPSVKDKPKDQATAVASSAQSDYTKVEPYQATPLTPRVLPHLRRQIKNEDAHPPQMQISSKGKNKENVNEGGEVFSRHSVPIDTKENAKAATTSGAFVKLDPGLQAWLDSQEKARFSNASTQDSASMPNETLIVIDPDSPEFSRKKTVPLPPGFVPIFAKDAAVKTETATPIEIKTSEAASPIAAHGTLIHDYPAAKDESATPEPTVPAKTTTEKEKIDAFLAEYNKGISSISAKYAKDSRKNSDAKEEYVDPPIHRLGYDPTYNPPKPSGTHELGSLLDAATQRLVMKPRTADSVAEGVAGQEWKAVRKDGKVVYVL